MSSAKEVKKNQIPKKKKKGFPPLPSKGQSSSLSKTENKVESKSKFEKPSSDVLKVMKQFKSLDTCPAFGMHNPFPKELEIEKVALSETLSSDKTTKELFVNISSISDRTDAEFSSFKTSRSEHKIVVSNHALKRASSRGISKEILVNGIETEGVKIIFGGQGNKSIVKTAWKTDLDKKDNWEALPEAHVSACYIKIKCCACSITFEVNEAHYKRKNKELPKKCEMCKHIDNPRILK